MNKLAVTLPAWFIERRVEPPYVVINDRILNNFGEMFQQAPDRNFYEAIAVHMNAYLKEGKMPPAEIAPAILNLIDDYAAGRRLNLKAGDYISLQSYLRKG